MTLPEYLIAGDTHKIQWSLGDYTSTNGYTATLYLDGPSPLTVTGVASNDEWLFTISSVRSSALTPGIYNATVRVTNSSNEQYSVDNSQIEIKRNPAAGTSRTLLCQQMIELVEKALANQLSEEEAISSISLSGRSLTFLDRSELMKEREYWYRELRAVKSAQNGDSGIKSIALNVGRF